ncbi:hypothetical protein GCM10028795_04600 [Lysobacter olei]
MKADMAAAVARYAELAPVQLEQLIAHEIEQLAAQQRRLAAMRKAQRIQRKQRGNRGKQSKP